MLHPNLLGSGLEVMVSLSVALILFEGGLNLELRDLGRISGSIRNLVTVGTLITLIGGGMAAHWLGEFPWPIAFLYASLVVVTSDSHRSFAQTGFCGQTSSHFARSRRRFNRSCRGNSGSIGTEHCFKRQYRLAGFVPRFNGTARSWRCHRSCGRLAARIHSQAIAISVRRPQKPSSISRFVGIIRPAEELRSESGLMATVLSGIVLRAASVPEERLLRRFKGQLTVLAISVLFVLLAADLSLASVVALGWGSVFTVLALMWVVRPINVWLCTQGSGLNWRQKLFACWVAPRGIVSASIASLFAILLTQRGINGGDSIKALVFLTIIITVFVQGLTAGRIAQLLGVTSKSATGAAIVGSNPLSRLIARLFQERGESVAIIDTNPEACEQAEKEGLRVFLSSALDHSVLEAAGLDSMGTFLAMTNNGEVNLVLAQRAAEEFAPPKVLAIFPKDPQGSTAANNTKIDQAFVSDLSLKDWNEYLSDQEVKLGETELKSSGWEFQAAHLQALIRSGELVPLLLERQGYLQVMSATETWQAGDIIIYLLHDPTPKLLKRLSGSSHSRLTLEKHPVVEEVPIPSPV